MTKPDRVIDGNFDDDLIARVRLGAAWDYRHWEPERVMVVLGRSNQAAKEVEEQRCQEDAIPILRRRGGGGTVVLSPGIVVISLAKRVSHMYFEEFFHKVNSLVIAGLQTLGIAGLSQQGHSDVCLGDRKILGSCLYGGQQALFYTASLMVDNDLALIDHYLKHPSREPDYRRGRSHREFLTTLRQAYPHLTVEEVIRALDAVLPARVQELD